MTITVTHTTPADSSFSAAGAIAWDANHSLVGVGTMAEQNANNVAITGGTMSGVAVSGYVPTSRTISTSTGLTGGGDLSADRTIAFADANIGTWAQTPTSANLLAAMTTKTGTGLLVFANSPTLSSPYIDNSAPWIDFGNGSAVALAAARMWYDGSNGSWNLGMGGGNITQQIGEEIFVYGKASSTITEGQLICKTGVVGASGQITFGPAPANLVDNDGIIGVATENIATGNFGRITYFGVVHGLDTTGSSAGQTWADGDTLYYNPVGGGLLTKVKPVAPNVKYQVATVIHAGNGGSGSLQVDLQAGTTLGGTDNNVQLTSPTGGQILSYDQTDQYWKNINLTAGSGISITPAAGGGITIANTSPSSGGTVTSVGGTGTVSGITLSGTVTSSGNLTLGGSLDLSSPPTIGSVTPNDITGATITAAKFVGVYGGAF